MADGFLSRRDFLKLSGAGLLALLLSEYGLNKTVEAAPGRQGRVLYASLVMRDAPAFSGNKVMSVKRDSIVEITASIQGGVDGDYNRTWYQIGQDGYVYSGGVQPVATVLNRVVSKIPKTGAVGEITIPYAGSTWAVNRDPVPGPRLYYATTHWVTCLVTDQRDGSLWYEAFDNQYNSHYYARPEHIRIIPAQELTPLSPQVPESDKHIEVNLEKQMLVAFELSIPVYAARVATGKVDYETPVGWFHTFHKRPTYHMTGGSDDSTVFDLPGVPWDSYFTDTGAAMHGTYWHNDFGHPHSHGCVNMAPQDAKWIYRWTLPSVPAGERLVLEPGQGTRVLVVRS